MEKDGLAVSDGAFSKILSHTPEVYREAAHANFDLMLSGHTHGGQICLPGSIPIKLEAVLPRRMGAGAWKYHNMTGYTSVGAGSSVLPVRLNCPPEITLHCLRRARSVRSRAPLTTKRCARHGLERRVNRSIGVELVCPRHG